MKELRNRKIILGLLDKIEERAQSLSLPVNIMEVCGTHTMTIHKYGLKKLLDTAGINMLSGPGCPVCITPNEIHEAAIDLITDKEALFLATFGDMTRVPTAKGSLQTVIPAKDSRIRIVYSPEESLALARTYPQKEIVFFGVGFETTIPSIALTAKQAWEENLDNYSILSALWLIPPPLKAILKARDTHIHGFLYPGHVSAIIGTKPYKFIARDYGIPGTVTGFEPGDVLLGILSILEQLSEGKARVSNEYIRVVRDSGNPQALAVMTEILDVKDAYWRGLGLIPNSGLRLKEKYSRFDAEKKHGFDIIWGSGDLPGCRCGEVLKGKISPPECSLFSKKCNPEQPYGPCMVSFEGACLAFYKYDLKER
jgi:hydrogenase expression/formation protein HypD